LDTIFPDFICEPLGNGLESQVVRAGKGRCPEVDEMEGARVISVENGGREITVGNTHLGDDSVLGEQFQQRHTVRQDPAPFEVPIFKAAGPPIQPLILG
jgi:hypothetical protein